MRGKCLWVAYINLRFEQNIFLKIVAKRPDICCFLLNHYISKESVDKQLTINGFIAPDCLLLTVIVSNLKQVFWSRNWWGFTCLTNLLAEVTDRSQKLSAKQASSSFFAFSLLYLWRFCSCFMFQLPNKG